MALVRPASGTQITAVNANNQFVDLLTGVMADQAVTFANNAGTVYPPSISVAAIAITGNFTAAAGEVDLWNANNAATQSFRFYQKTAASVALLIMTMYASGGVYIGTTGLADPGGGQLWASGNIRAGAGLANQLEMHGVIAGQHPIIQSVGSDTNVDIILLPKGTGVVTFANNAAASGTGATTNLQASAKGAGGGPVNLASVTWVPVKFGFSSTTGFIPIFA